jgi:hypothetical protein
MAHMRTARRLGKQVILSRSGAALAVILSRSGAALGVILSRSPCLLHRFAPAFVRSALTNLYIKWCHALDIRIVVLRMSVYGFRALI